MSLWSADCGCSRDSQLPPYVDETVTICRGHRERESGTHYRYLIIVYPQQYHCSRHREFPLTCTWMRTMNTVGHIEPRCRVALWLSLAGVGTCAPHGTSCLLFIVILSGHMMLPTTTQR